MAKYKAKKSAKTARRSKINFEGPDAEPSGRFNLHHETKKSILGVIFFVGGLILLFSPFGLAGDVGKYLHQALALVLGVGYYLVPILFFLISALFLLSKRYNIYFITIFGSALFLISILGLIDEVSPSLRPAGYLGLIVGYPLDYLFGFWTTIIILVSTIFVAVLIIFNLQIGNFFNFLKKPKDEAQLVVNDQITNFDDEDDEDEEEEEERELENREPEDLDSDLPKPGKKAKLVFHGEYALPPLKLLDKNEGTPGSGDVKAYSTIIQKTLEHFGIPVEMSEVNIGPTVTQYTLKPAQGVKLAKITALHNDLALALAAHPIRIEAPIPGRSLVGIEIPNKSIAIVRLRNLLEEEGWQKTASPLTFALGRDVAGNPVFSDLAKMPHLLIAGSTGSGKSVSIHSILTSFLFRNYPEILRFIIIDPKRVELAVYSGIPHLLSPVVIEREKAIKILHWAVKEMEQRYEKLSEAGSRDIDSFNNFAVKNKNAGAEIMPYLVIVIDELADLMAAYPREVEASIVRLAQMARAVGIHLIISTQRPSVDVITGLIKANITSRIAFQVASSVDSRTILDMAGAEKLLGNGDMLFMSSDTAKSKRIQGGFISEQEVKKVTEYLRIVTRETGYLPENIIDLDSEQNKVLFASGDDDFDDDNLIIEAKDLVKKLGKASATLLQRHLRIGYARAARILDILEKQGVVGPAEGAKPRRVYGASQDFNQLEDREEI